MATAQKKSTAGKRTASSASRSRSGTGRQPAAPRASGGRGKAPQPKPIRREVGAGVCLLLAIFSFLGYFNSEAFFTGFICGLAKGLIGYGFWLLPPMLLVSSVVLLFHRGRPVRLRVWCALLTPVLLGCFLHLVLAKGDYTWGLDLFGTLWDEGRAMASGGVLSGLVAQVFTLIFSRVGSGIVLILVGVIMVMAVCNVTVVDVYDYIRDRPRPEYEEELPPPRPKERKRAPAPPPPPPEPQPAPQRGRPAKRKGTIDIPMDDGPLELEPEDEVEEIPPKKGFFNRNPSVPTPDQLLSAPAARPEPPPDVFTVPDRGPLPQAPDKDVFAPPPSHPIPPEPRPAPDPASAVEPKPEPLPPMPEIVREPAVPKNKAEQTAQAAAEVSRDIEKSMEAGTPVSYQYPPVSLLKEGEGVSSSDVAGELRANQARLADTIRSFGIEANIADVTRGPSVTRYEVELDQGVRLNKLTNLSDDIALALGATGVRIAPIPDKISMVGVEVPNKLVSPVFIHDVIDSPEFRNHASKVCFSVGKDIGGNCIVGNIAKLPHLLIAGTTGSGKSVCTNSLIISLLYKATPEEVRLIMVDPKMVELGIYNGIPHLLIPVVTDPKKAAGALQWAVTEMMKRYRSFAEVGVRDLASYNAMAARTEGMNKMPQVVVVIDELADLMLVAAKEVEESICRVAQMGRASGMHLIIATQRPSADVITGLMKANIPSRIAFAVASSLESRIILDTTGAEKLVGRGDMLYFPLGTGKPQRVQGCLISDEEVAAVVEYVKRSGSADYDEAVIHEIEQHAAEKEKGSKGVGGPSADDSGGDYDELLPAAIEVVVDTGQASVSMLQRRLKLGYSRAARLVDQMEEKGIVGPFEGSKPRQLLITREQWQEMQFRQGMVDKAPDRAIPAAPEPYNPNDDPDEVPFDLEES